MQKPQLTNVDVPQPDDSEDDVSLFRGGLFYRAQVVAHLIDAERWNVWRRVAIVLTVAWLPLVIITALFDRDQLVHLLTDYEVYSRVAIAIPVLLIGQLVMEDRFSVVAKHVRQARLLSDEDLYKLKGVLATIRRFRDSPLSELIIIALVVVDLTLIWQSRVASGPGWAVYRSGGVAHLRPAGWYYGLVSAPLYQLLIGLCFWKWLLWCLFLFRLSRMDLKLVATHPDAHGGLGFLGLSAVGFIPVAFALSSVIGGSWSNEILNNGARLESFQLPAIILIVLTFIIALAPLALFVRRLDVLRRTAMLEYGVLAQRQASYLHGKWFSHGSGSEGAQFTVAEVTALADFAMSYRNIKQMRPFPADKGTLIGLALAVIVPLFPAVLAEFPFSVIVKGLLQAVKAVPM
jgi:hypothetical protein